MKFDGARISIIDSDRKFIQLKKFEIFKANIENLLKKIEDEYQIKIFYASETGSRGLGNDVDESDFDITGFFVPLNILEYFKIIRKYEKTIKISQQKIFVNNNFYDVDVELWDFKMWLNSKVVSNTVSCDFWFESDLIYRNLYPDIIKEIKQFIIPPYLLYWGKSRSGIGYNEKDIKNKGECLNKSLLNVLTNLIFYAHYQIFLNFPKFNIFDEIDYLKDKKNEIIQKNILSEEEFQIIETNVKIYLNLFEEKKINRKSTKNKIPEAIYDLMKFLEKRYGANKKKCELEMLINEETAQKWFDNIMNRN